MKPDESFLSLLYRYWFFGWLFRDADRGSQQVRALAMRYNRERAIWLPTYIRRWVVLGLILYLTGLATELAGFERLAPTAFILACLTVPVSTVGAAGWWVLRRPIN